MYKISEKYQNYLENELSLSTKSKIVVDGKEYLSNIIKTTPKISHKNEKMIGGFPTKTCSFEIYNFEDLDFVGKEITVYRGLLIDGEIEYIPQGIFIPRKEDITTNISQKTISFNNIQDKTQFFDSQYISNLDWSTKHTGLEIVQEICNRLDIELETIDFNWSTYEFKQPNFLETTTYREVISRLAEIGGNIAFINRLGQLTIKGQFDTKHSIARKRYENLTKEKEYGIINTIVLGKEDIDDDIVYPINTNEKKVEWKILDNPFVDLYREEMIMEVSKYILGLNLIPFSLSRFIDGFYLDLNDTLEITDKNGEVFTGIILNYENLSRIKSEIGADVQTTENTNYNLAGSQKQNIRDVKFQVNHNTQAIQGLVEEIDGTNEKVTKLEIDIDSIEQEVSYFNDQSQAIAKLTTAIEGIEAQIGSITDTTVSANGVNKISLENVLESEVLYLQIYPTSEDLGYLNVSPKTVLSNNTKITSRDLILTNTTSNKTVKYTLPCNLYYISDDVKDELIVDYEKEQTYVIHRVGINAETGDKYSLAQETTEFFDYKGIILEDGNYSIKMQSFNTAYIYIRCLAKNLYTSQYATRVEVDNKISLSESGIRQEVNGKITALDGTVTNLKGSLELKLNTKDLCTELNGSADKISFVGDRFSWKSTYSSMSETGTLKATNVDLSGKITASSGTIGGFTITSNSIYKGSNALGTSGSGNIYLGTNGLSISNTFKVTNAGVLTATGATINGTITTSNITATGGTIGGFTITSNSIYKGSNTFGASGTGNIYIGTNGISISNTFKVSNAGKLTATNVDLSGKITATSGTIGGCTIESGVLKIGNANITSINASKITAGTLSADRISGGTISGNKVSITNINASNITGGSMSMSRISGGTLNVGATGYYLRVGVGYTHPTVSGLNVTGGGGINMYGNCGISNCYTVANGDDLYLASNEGTVHLGHGSSGSGHPVEVYNSMVYLNQAVDVTTNSFYVRKVDGTRLTLSAYINEASSIKMKENILPINQDFTEILYQEVKDLKLYSFDYIKKYINDDIQRKNKYGFMIEDVKEKNIGKLLDIEENNDISLYSGKGLAKLDLILIKMLIEKIEKLESRC